MNKAVVLVLCLLVAIVYGSSFDYTNYCGLPEYPAQLDAIPPINDSLIKEYSGMFVFHRHGDRSTIVKNCFKSFPPRVYTECDASMVNYPNAIANIRKSDPLDFNVATAVDANTIAGNCFAGQLTKRGFLMSYNNGLRFGSYLNTTFSRFGGSFDPSKMTMRTTDVHRTLETAQSFVTGLVDGSGTQYQARNMQSMTFADVNTDYIRLGSNMCKTNEYVKEAYAAEAWVKYKADVWDPLSNELSIALNEKNADINDVFDCMMINQCHKTPQPTSAITADLIQRTTDAATQYWIHGFGYDQVRSTKVFSGPLVYNLVKQITAAYTGEQPAVHILSGHDFGPMMNLASALGFLETMPYWPPYHASIAIEMVNRADGIGSFVRFLWQGVVVKPSWCNGKYVGDLCPTSALLNYLSDRVPSAEDCPSFPFDKTLETMIANAKTKQQKGMYKGSDINMLEGAVKPLLGRVKTLVPQEEEGKPLSDEERWAKALQGM